MCCRFGEVGRHVEAKVELSVLDGIKTCSWNREGEGNDRFHAVEVEGIRSVKDVDSSGISGGVSIVRRYRVTNDAYIFRQLCSNGRGPVLSGPQFTLSPVDNFMPRHSNSLHSS